MYSPTTTNKYSFKYLQTGVTGPGIPHVYLPEKPTDKHVKDFGGKWFREELPKDFKVWIAEETKQLKAEPQFFHEVLNEYRAKQWDKRIKGTWFWNTVNGKREATYITGLHFFYIQWWKTTFGYPKFLDTDKEFFYWWAYIEEDPFCYGGIFGTGRRGGKSAKMAAVMFEFCSRNFFANGGSQGESADKMKEFFRMHLIYPFKNLPEFFRPKYDQSTALKTEIVFTPTLKKGAGQSEFIEEEGFEGKIDFGPTDANYYNSAKLKRFLIEEGGKIKKVLVSKMHAAVKETMREFENIIGKGLYASTADEEDDVTEDFKKLVFDSDFDKRGEDGQTTSGMYFAFMPFQYLLRFDEFGIPMAEESMKVIHARRKKYIDSPGDYALECRKMPITLEEYFYVNPSNCQFDVMVLQNRNSVLSGKTNITSKMKPVWTGEPFAPGSMVKFVPHPDGRFKISWLPEDISMTNNVQDTGNAGPNRFIPQNERLYCSGTDPIDYKVEEMMGNRRSSAAAFVKRRYNSALDEEPTEANLQHKRNAKIPYRSSMPILQYHGRPDDPNIYYMEMLMMCIYFGIGILVEKQKGNGLINFFAQRGYARFIMKRPVSTYSQDARNKTESSGIDANTLTISRYTSLIATDVYWYGHSYPFVDLVNQLLKFDPGKTTQYDLAVAWGWTLMAELKEVHEKPAPLSLDELFELVNYSSAT